MIKKYCTPIGYMWVSANEIPEPELRNIRDNDYICQVVSENLNISIEQMKSKSRKREIVTARHISMYFDKSLTSMTLKEIGHAFGNRDRTTVIHAINTVNDLKDTDKTFISIFKMINYALL